MQKPRILIVDDDKNALESLARAISVSDIAADIHSATNASKALELFSQILPSLAIIDLSLNETEGVESGYGLLKNILKLDNNCRVIVLTGHSGVEYGVRALALGAAHFLPKPADIPHITALIKDCLNQFEIRSSLTRFQNDQKHELLQSIVGNSSAIIKLREQIDYAAHTSQSVFIRGETGTGKGLCAKLIHQLSNRKSAPFIRYQPTFSTSDLANSELFGHKKGAFTGAINDRRGLLLEASNGTLFLDEVDELPHDLQVTLLGVLHERTFRSVGDDKEQKATFRVISASNANIESEIESGRFRLDLFHRLSQYQIQIPALRERREDIPALALHALQELKAKEQVDVLQIDQAVFNKLAGYSWPGNVRELESVITSAAWRAQYHARKTIEVSDLSLSEATSSVSSDKKSLYERVSEFEEQIINRALLDNLGSLSAAARALGINRATVKRISERSKKPVF
jgi:DNA-binding NtrC family response regulator